jgi:hypothetical protein
MATDEDGSYNANDVTVNVARLPLQVTALTATDSGFDVQFNHALDASELNLYETSSGSLGAADVVLRGATSGLVKGAMVVDAASGELRFVKTGGALAADTYTVTLRSGADAFEDWFGSLLDGNNDGIAGDDAVRSFSVSAAAAAAPTLSLPDFARGPGQAVDVPATSAGVPITLSNGAGITDISFELTYDPALLVIDSVQRGAGLPAGADFNFTLDPATGKLQVQISGAALASGAVQLVSLVAHVPDSAPYGAMQVLDLSNLRLNAGAVAGRSDDGVALVAYFGDTDGDAVISRADVTTLNAMVVVPSSGLAAYGNADPRLVGDITGDGVLNVLDVKNILYEATYIERDIAAYNRPQIPDIPGGITLIRQKMTAATVNIATTLTTVAGAQLSVPVHLDQAQGLESVQFELVFDPTLLRLDNVLRGDLTQGFEVLTALTSPGRVLVTMSGAALGAGSGDIAELVFTALGEGASVLDLQSVRLNGGNQQLVTEPVAGADASDGQVVIGAAPAPLVATTFDPQGQSTAPVFGAPAADVPQQVALDLGLSYWNAANTATSTPGSLPAPTQSDNWVRGFVSNLARPTPVTPNASISISLLRE